MSPRNSPPLYDVSTLDADGRDIVSDPPTDGLPPIVDACELLEDDIKTPPLVIHDVLHQGLKMILAGASKAMKTWILQDLAIAVALGIPWLN